MYTEIPSGVPEKWRSRVAAIIDIRLEWIFLVRVDVDTLQLTIHQIGKIEGPGPLQVARIGGLHRSGNLIDGKIGAGQRRRRDDVHP